MAIPNDYDISNINPYQNDRDYFTQKIDIEKENAIQIEGKFFLNSILIALEAEVISFHFKEKKKKFQVKNNLLNKKRQRAKKNYKIIYKKFKRENLNRIIKESNLPKELKREIYKPNINIFITNLKESPYFYENLLNFTFKDNYIFGKEVDEKQKLNYENISNILEFCQTIKTENLDENLRKIIIFFQIKIGDLLPKNWKFDNAIKYIKQAISKYGTKKLNKLINESDLPEIYKNKIYLPNYKLFTAKDSIKDNKKFLSMPQTDIFTIGKDNCKLQKLNHENILKILEYSESSQKYLKMTYEV